jgi:hypothetical protein
MICFCGKAPWAAGSEYVYRMHAISVSDIPELGPQAAGVKFDSQLMVQCRDAGSIIVKVSSSHRALCQVIPPCFSFFF